MAKRYGMALPLLAASGVGVVFREHITTSPPVRSDSCEAIVPLDEMRWIRVSRVSPGTGKRPSAVTPPVPGYPSFSKITIPLDPRPHRTRVALCSLPCFSERATRIALAPVARGAPG